ncbi:MAG: hypothetical protein R2781_11205 [Flavobacteriaceae bacterium]
MHLSILMLLLTLSIPSLAQTNTKSKWVDTETSYSDDFGNSVRVTNSLPKGGGTYTTTKGKTYSYVIFWHQLTNISKVPLELSLVYPSEPSAIFPHPDAHIRLFFPPETMTLEKIDAFNYGISHLNEFLDSTFFETSSLQKIIRPNETYYFYTAIVFYKAQGSARAKLVKEGAKAIYELKVGNTETKIPSGQIIFKK